VAIVFFNRQEPGDCYYLIMPTRYYKNAPIAEAIINIQFRQAEAFDSAVVRALGEVFAERFPIKSPIHFVEFNVGSLEPNSPGSPAAPTPTEVGIRLSNEKNDRVLQVQQGSFAFSHMPPYSSWGQFRAEAKSLWELFTQNYGSLTVTRCAVRFINKISIPKSTIELRDYFNLYPQLPEGISQDVAGMLLQLQMPQSDLGATAVINLALAQPELPEHMTVVLDIDLLADQPGLAADSPNVWAALDQARTRKNDLFESFITDETRKIIS
jgi:uncharacterized protein (TIGR04255 family)